MATFGYTTIGSSGSTDTNGDEARCQVETLTEAGDVSKLTMYGRAAGATGNVKAAIWEDDGGAPGALVAVGDETTMSASNEWNDLPFASPVALAAADWWLGFLTETGRRVYYDTGGPGGIGDLSAGNYTSPPDPFPSGSIGSVRVSLYATYTPSGGSPTPQSVSASSTRTAGVATVATFSVSVDSASTRSAGLVKQISKTLAAASTRAAALARRVSKAIGASSTRTAGVTPALLLLQAVAAASARTAVVTPLIVLGHTISAASTRTATLVKTISKSIGAASTRAAALVRTVGKSIAASGVRTAAMVKQVSKTVAAASVRAAVVTPVPLLLQTISAASTRTAAVATVFIAATVSAVRGAVAALAGAFGRMGSR